MTSHLTDEQWGTVREIKLCIVDGCSRPAPDRRMCAMHYDRNRTRGSVGSAKPEKRLHRANMAWLLDTAMQAGSKCAIWPGWLNEHGYGRVHFFGKRRPAHRVALILATGVDPKGLLACHGPCHTPACCNPKHLSWGTVKQNAKDRRRDGTLRPNRKLTAEQVRCIRADNRIARLVAAEHDVSVTTVRDIWSGRRWPGTLDDAMEEAARE